MKVYSSDGLQLVLVLRHRREHRRAMSLRADLRRLAQQRDLGRALLRAQLIDDADARPSRRDPACCAATACTNTWPRVSESARAKSASSKSSSVYSGSFERRQRIDERRSAR